MITNLFQLFFENAKLHPNRIALVFGDVRMTYFELAKEVQKYQAGLQSRGFQAGERIVWLSPLSTSTYSFTVACFAIGAVPVFIEGGLPLATLRKCLQQAKPTAIISTQKLFKALPIIPEIWQAKKYSTDWSGNGFQNLWLQCFENLKSKIQPTALPGFVHRSPEDLCLLSFTTGSTGVPKAAERTLEILLSQHLLSRKYWPDLPTEVDMPVFPNVVFQNLLCGITSVLPELNFQEVGQVNAFKVVEQIQRHRVTRISGSPTFLMKICEEINRTHRTLPLVRSVIAGGAPVSKKLALQINLAFPKSQNFVVYGSTEVEPISFAPLKSVIDNQDSGYFVGAPLSEVGVQLLDRNRKPSPEGEIWVSGPHVVKKYFQNDIATHATKFTDREGVLWHRTGDWGRQSFSGQISILGRASDMIITPSGMIPNYIVESELETLSNVERAGVLSRDSQIYICVQPKDSVRALGTEVELRKILKNFQIPNSQIQWFDKIPVDPRHNSKIDRRQLESGVTKIRARA